MDTGPQAYGAGKVGGAFDVQNFVRKPHVFVRLLSLLFGLIVYFCASSGSWTIDPNTKEEVCMFKMKRFNCHIGGFVGFTSVIVAAVFVGGEYYFENVPSVKSRKHYVLLDLGFSSLWAFWNFLLFCYLSNAWSNTPDFSDSISTANPSAAIYFTLFAIFVWGTSAYFAYQRYQMGVDPAFVSSFEADQFGTYDEAQNNTNHESPFNKQLSGEYQTQAY
ncbi:synaptogyrin [Daktulosphaira vitifoliae]|uniref:synaptogyrin n=1 Tax=Daktulosphaira vitifoliae TaxID=58002 RepID=UPI0021AA89E2|nr:synaptogyrin [Daktulosphaira vitifoliae]